MSQAVFSTIPKGERFLDHFSPRASFVERLQPPGREFSYERIAQMSQKSRDSVEAAFQALRVFTIGSPGSVSIMQTCQMMGMGQLALVAAIGGPITDTPKMTFQRKFLRRETGLVASRINGGFVLTQAGTQVLDGLAGLQRRGDDTILPKEIWQALVVRLNIPEEAVFYPEPQEQPVALVNPEDLRNRFNQARVRRGLQEGAPLQKRVALDLDLARRMSQWAERNDELTPGLLQEIAKVRNMSVITNRVKMVEVFDKVEANGDVELDDGELVTLGKLLNAGPREEFYNLNLEPLRNHPQAEEALLKVGRFKEQTAGRDLRNLLELEMRPGRGRSSGRGGRGGNPPPETPPRGDSPATGGTRVIADRLTFRTPRAGPRIRVDDGTPPEAPPAQQVGRHYGGGRGGGQEPATAAAPAGRTIATPVATGNPPGNQTTPNGIYREAGENLPPRPQVDPDTCPITAQIFFGRTAVSQQGNRYNIGGLVGTDGEIMENDPATRTPANWRFEDLEYNAERAVAHLIHDGILDGENPDTADIQERPNRRQIELIGIADGLEAALVAQGLEGQYEGIVQEFEAGGQFAEAESGG